MGKKPTRKSNILRAFFKDGYSVQTIAAFYGIEVVMVEEVIRKYCKKTVAA